nr:NAD-binding protein [Feifania hominis]
MLIGGRGKAKALAQSLLRRGCRVTVINESVDDCHMLAQVERLNVIHGDGTKPHVLEDAGAAQADLAVALTSQDEANLLICELCKRLFGVSKTISLLCDPKKTDFFYQMGVDHVVCAVSAVTAIMEQQAFVGKIANTLPIGAEQIQIAEVPISGGAPAVGKKLWEINLPRDVVIGCILRGDRAMIPRGDTVVLSGDMLVLISSNGQELAAIRELTGR